MGLLDEICERRLRLSHTTTVVTTAEGKVFREESSSDGFRVSEILNKDSVNHPGFVVDLKPDLEVAQVMAGLCLGSQDVTQEVDILKKYGITDIVSLGVEVLHLESYSVNYHFIPILDLPETELLSVLNQVLPLIHDLISKNRVVFVHCNAGVSRSPSVVIAYLIKFQGMCFQDAFELVRSKRASTKPNAGFLEQLKNLEKQSRC